MLVKSMVENYEDLGLPLRFVEVLPIYCDSCGWPLDIGEALTGLHCTNDRCPDKLVMRIRGICKALNITDFGESTIEKFVESYDVKNHLMMFALRSGMDLGEGVSPKISEKVTNQIDSNRQFVLWEFVQVANLPFVHTSARKIFQGYTDLNVAYSDIEAGGVGFIQEKLGIQASDELSIQAVKVYNTLMTYKDDLLEALEYIDLVDLGEIKELNVVCSDQVGGGFAKKSEFYDFIAKEFNDKVKVHFLSSVNKTIDYLVWAGADGSDARYTSKVKKVEGYNEKGSNIPIVTADQFIDILRSM